MTSAPQTSPSIPAMFIATVCLICFAAGRTQAETWTTIYEEDFSTDPGWATNNPARYFTGPDGTYRVTMFDDTNEYGTVAVPYMGQSFRLTFDVFIDSMNWAGDVNIGLYDSSRTVYETNTWPFGDAQFAAVNFGKGDWGKGIELRIRDNYGAFHQANEYPTSSWDFNTWYTATIAYEQQSGAIDWELRNRESGVVVNAMSVTGVSGFTTLVNLGASKVGDFYYPPAYGAALVDNVVLAEAAQCNTLRAGLVSHCQAAPYAGGSAFSPNDSSLFVAIWEDFNGSRVFEYPFPIPPSCPSSNVTTFGNWHTHDDVVVSLDGERIFTTNYYPSSVSQYRLVDGGRVDLSTIDTWPAAIEMTPNGTKLVVGVGMDGQPFDEGNDSVAIYDVSSGGFTLLASIELPDEPRRWIAITEDSSFAYVVTHKRQSPHPMLYEIALTPPYQVTRSMEFATSSEELAVACRGDRLFVSDPGNDRVWVVDRSSWSIQPQSINIGGADGLKIHPSRDLLFVVLRDNQAIAVFDADSLELVATIDGLMEYPRDLDFNSDGRFLAVTHYNPSGDVMIYELAFDCAAPEILLRTGREPDAECVETGQTVSVELQVANLADATNGVQGLISYDPAVMSLNTAATAEAPGWTRIFLFDNGGQVTYAAIRNGGSVGPGAGPFTVATLVFEAVGEGAAHVAFRPDQAPLATKLTLAGDGGAIGGDDLVKTDSGVVSVDDTVPTAGNTGPVCADSGVEFLGGPDSMAGYAWSGPNGFSSNMQNPTVAPAEAGEYCLTVTNAEGCAFGPVCTTVEVYPCLTVNIVVPGLVDGPVEREVSFLLSTCNGDTESRAIPVGFTPSGPAGVGKALLFDVHPGLDWVHVLEGHTLSTLAAVNLGGGSATVDVVLRSGDLQAGGIAQDGVVDVLDFSILASRWGAPVTDCAGGDPQDCSFGADVTGDALQNETDFALMQNYFFEVGDDPDDCGEGAGVTPGLLHKVPLTSITLAKLRRVLPAASKADLTRDGVVDVRDMRALARKQRMQLSAVVELRSKALDAAAHQAVGQP